MADFNVRLTYDNSELLRGIQEDKRSFGDLSRSVDQFESTTTSASRNSVRELSKVEQSGNKLIGTFGKLAAAIGVALGTRQIINFGRSAIKAAGDYEQLGVAVGVFVGNQEKANKLLLEAQKLSIVTPFTPDELFGATKALLAYGVEQDKVIGSLRVLGDVSAGIGKPIGQLSDLFGRVAVEGRLTGITLRQFTQAGIPLITELATQIGVSEDQIRSMVSSGSIGFGDVEEAFASMTGEGGRFFQLMEKQSQTLNGRISTLSGIFKDFSRIFGEELAPLAKQATEQLIALSERFTADDVRQFGASIRNIVELFIRFGPTLLATAAAFAAVRLGVVGSTAAIQANNRSIDSAREAQIRQLQAQQQLTIARREYLAAVQAANTAEGQSIANQLRLQQATLAYTQAQRGATAATGGFTLAQRAKAIALRLSTLAVNALRAALSVIGIGLVIQGISLLISNFERLKDIINGVTEAQRSLINLSADLESQYIKEASQVDRLFSTLSDFNKTKSEQLEAVKALREQYPDLLKNYDLENASLEELRDIQAQVTENIFETIKARVLEEKQVEVLQRLAELRREENRLLEEGLTRQQRFADGYLGVGEEQGVRERVEVIRKGIDDVIKGFEDEKKAVEDLAEFNIFATGEIDDEKRKSFELQRSFREQLIELDNKALQIELENAKQRKQALAQAGGGAITQEAVKRLEFEIREIEDLLERRNEVVKKRGAEQVKINEDFEKELEKIRDTIQGTERKYLLDQAKTNEERLNLARKFQLEDLALRKTEALALAQSRQERLKVEELFNELELQLQRQYSKDLIDAIQDEAREEDKAAEQRLKDIERRTAQERQLRLQAIETQLAGGGLSQGQLNALNEERLQLELSFEKERAERLSEAAKDTQVRIAEAISLGDTDRVEALTNQLEAQEAAIRQNGQAILIAEARLIRERVDQQVDAIQEFARVEDLRLQNQLKAGNFSLRQQRQIELDRLAIQRDAIKAQLALLPEDSIAALRLREDREGLDAEIAAIINTTIPALRDAGELFQQTLLENFGISEEASAELVGSFDVLKGAIFDTIKGGYDLELEAIDQTISERQKGINELKKQINEEQRAREKGFANNVDALEKRLEREEELLLEDERKKNEIKIREARFEAQIQSLQQGAQLATAVANIIRSESRLGAAGIITAGAAIVSMFAIWRKFRQQSQQLSEPVSLFTGGKIGDHMKPGYSPQSDRPGHGSGHMIEGTNIRVGADEWLLNAKTSKKQGKFIGEFLNSGMLDNVDLYGIFKNGYLKPDDGDSLMSVKKASDLTIRSRQKKEAKYLSKFQAREMERIISEQTQVMEKLDSRRPIVIAMPDGTIQKTTYKGDKKTTEIIKSK